MSSQSKAQCDTILDAVYKERPGIDTFRDRAGRIWFSVIRFPDKESWDSYAMLDVLYQFLQVVTTSCGEALDWRAHRFMDWAQTIVESAQRDEKLFLNKEFRDQVKAVRDTLEEPAQLARFLKLVARLAVLLDVVRQTEED